MAGERKACIELFILEFEHNPKSQRLNQKIYDRSLFFLGFNSFTTIILLILIKHFLSKEF